MARGTTRKPINDTPGPADATAEQTAAQQEAQRQEADAEAEAEEKREAAAGLAEDQRRDIAEGGTGLVDIPEGTPVHSITDPKAVPVDYAKQNLRRPPQRILPPDAMERHALSEGPIVNQPYGSEPRSIDPATGLAPAPEPGSTDEAAIHGADVDADVDGGGSATDRAARAS